MRLISLKVFKQASNMENIALFGFSLSSIDGQYHRLFYAQTLLPLVASASITNDQSCPIAAVFGMANRPPA